MIYDIAMGALIALTVYNVLDHIAKEIAIRINQKRRSVQLRKLIDSWDDEYEDYQFSTHKPSKKAPPKKKATAKRK